MRQRSSILIAILGAVAALVVVGCDGDDGGAGEAADREKAGDRAEARDRAEAGDRGEAGDVREIRRVIERFLLAKDSRLACRELSTRDLVQRIFGDVPQCEKAARSDDDSEPPTGVRTSGVNVASDSATARVRFLGGDNDGAEGILELRRERSRWRVDDFGVNLLRALILTGLRSEAKDDELLKRPPVRSCVRRVFDDLSDDELKRVAYLSISEREGSKEEVGKLLLPCLSRPGSGRAGNRSHLRDKFEEGIVKQARRDGVPRAAIDCIVRRLRSSVTDAQLRQLVTRRLQTTPEIARKVARAALECRSQAPPSASS